MTVYSDFVVFTCSATHTHDEESNVENKWLLEYSKLLENAGTAKPLSLALSEFHFLLLSNNMLKVYHLVILGSMPMLLLYAPLSIV